MQIIDLSVALNHETRVQGEDTGYQDPPVVFEPWLDIEHKYQITKIEMGAHAGTHCDAPSHVVKGGNTISDYSLDYWIGWAVVMDFRGKGPVSDEMIVPFKSRIAGRRYMIPVLRHGFTDYLTAAARKELLSWRPQAVLVGEGINVDQNYDDTYEFLKAGVPMIMNADHQMVAQIEEDDLIIAAPLKFTDLEAAPMRLFAIRGLTLAGGKGKTEALDELTRIHYEDQIEKLERLIGQLTLRLESKDAD